MRQARAQMIAGPVEENLRLIFEPAKRTRMNDPRTIALKFHPIRMRRLRIFSSARIARFLGKWRQRETFGRLHFLARPVAASLCEARRRCSLLVHVNDYSLVVDLGES